MSKRRSTPWPRTLGKDTVLTAHTLAATGAEHRFRLKLDGGKYQWQFAQPDNGGWTVTDLGDPQPSIAAAIDLNRIGLLLGKGYLVEIQTRPEHERTVMLAMTPHRVIAEDGEGWPEEITADWDDIDDELPVALDHVPVWASINGARLLLVTPDGTRPYPVLFDRDEGAFTGLEVLAETSWFSESGGAPISWDGGSRLSRLYPGMLWSHAWGDVRQETEAIPATGPVQIGHAVAEFILADDQQFAAAWLLEPFDIDGRLDAQQALEWAALAEGVEVSVSIDLEPGEELPNCRTRLQQDPAYAAVAEALADPTSPRGLRLRAKLEDVRDSGVLGGILGYNLGDL